MAVYSGTEGYMWANDTAKELNVRNWSISLSAGVATGAHSSSAGWTQAVMGTKGWTASVEIYDDSTLAGAAGTEPFVLGESCTCQFWDGNRSFDGSAIIADVAYNCDIEGGEMTASSVTIQGNGALVIAATTPAAP